MDWEKSFNFVSNEFFSDTLCGSHTRFAAIDAGLWPVREYCEDLKTLHTHLSTWIIPVLKSGEPLICKISFCHRVVYAIMMNFLEKNDETSKRPNALRASPPAVGPLPKLDRRLPNIKAQST